MGDVRDRGPALESYSQVIRVRIRLHSQERSVLGLPILEEIVQGLGGIVGRPVRLAETLIGSVDAMAILAGADLAGLVGNPIAFLDDALIICAEQVMGH